jgi:hypothetical protein
VQGIIYDLMAEQQDSYETGRSLIVSEKVGIDAASYLYSPYNTTLKTNQVCIHQSHP